MDVLVDVGPFPWRVSVACCLPPIRFRLPGRWNIRRIKPFRDIQKLVESDPFHTMIHRSTFKIILEIIAAVSFVVVGEEGARGLGGGAGFGVRLSRVRGAFSVGGFFPWARCPHGMSRAGDWIVDTHGVTSGIARSHGVHSLSVKRMGFDAFWHVFTLFLELRLTEEGWKALF